MGTDVRVLRVKKKSMKNLVPTITEHVIGAWQWSNV